MPVLNQWFPTLFGTDMSRDGRAALAAALTIMPLMAQSTGVKDSATLASQYTKRTTPFIQPTHRAYGPFKLSSQPGKGSAHVLSTTK